MRSSCGGLRREPETASTLEEGSRRPSEHIQGDGAARNSPFPQTLKSPALGRPCRSVRSNGNLYIPEQLRTANERSFLRSGMSDHSFDWACSRLNTRVGTDMVSRGWVIPMPVCRDAAAFDTTANRNCGGGSDLLSTSQSYQAAWTRGGNTANDFRAHGAATAGAASRAATAFLRTSLPGDTGDIRRVVRDLKSRALRHVAG